MVGAYGHDEGGADAGAAYVILGGPERLSGEMSVADADTKLNGEAPGDLGARSVAGGGDASGDGVPDLFVGAEGDDTGGEDAGAAYLLFGSPAEWVRGRGLVPGATEGGPARFSLAVTGDLRGGFTVPDRGTEQRIRSARVDGLSVSGAVAVVEAMCRIDRADPLPCTVRAEDHHGSPQPDEFRIRVFDTEGGVAYEAGGQLIRGDVEVMGSGLSARLTAAR